MYLLETVDCPSPPSWTEKAVGQDEMKAWFAVEGRFTAAIRAID